MAAVNSPKKAKQEVKEQAEGAKEAAQEKGQELWIRMAEAMNKMRSNANGWTNNFITGIRNRPMQSIAIASLAGFLIGVLRLRK